MCDCCPAPGNSAVHLYTVSIFTGERLCVCLACSYNNAEPENSIIHGVNKGALDKLPKSIKDQITIWTMQGYCSIYALDRHLKRHLPLAAPEYPAEEQDEAAEIMKKMKDITAEFDRPRPRRSGLVSTILQYILPEWGRSAQSAP